MHIKCYASKSLIKSDAYTYDHFIPTNTTLRARVKHTHKLLITFKISSGSLLSRILSPFQEWAGCYRLLGIRRLYSLFMCQCTSDGCQQSLYTVLIQCTASYMPGSYLFHELFNNNCYCIIIIFSLSHVNESQDY